MNHRLDELIERYPDLASCRDAVMAAFERMCDCYREGGKLLLCGNGGSAADADHWSGELLKGFCSARPLSPDQRRGLDAGLADRLQNALPAIPLGSFPALASAYANDVDAEITFAQLVWALGRPGDILVGLTTSGNARNVLAAAKVARAQGMAVIALTGAGGGALAEASDICIKAPATETFKVQECHLPIYHTLCLMLEETFFGETGQKEGTKESK